MQKLIWVGIFAVIGVTVLILAHASSSSSIEPEDALLSKNVVIVNDTAASGGKAIKFSPPSCPSNQCIPIGDITSGGHLWHQIVAEDFTKDAQLGSWANACSPSAILYTGATGTPWRAYPACDKDTYQHRPYRSDQVLSVHDGVLDFWLHNVDGIPAGANPSPNLPNGTPYQIYGRYEVRFKTSTASLSEFYQAWLLWPNDNTLGRCAESDFPESTLSSTAVSGFAHYCDAANVNHQTSISGLAVDRTQWHTFTQEWLPGLRNYYIDGVLKGSASTNIWDQPERWQLQTETKTSCDQTLPIACTEDGHLLIDWATVYSY